MKTMKVIDLLVRIANGTEVPKKIKWEDTIYAYSDINKDYLEYPFSDYEYQGLFCMKDSVLTQYLNDEVEIIEDTPKEEKKIEKLIIYDDSINWCCNGRAITDTEKDIIDKLNEIIDKINGE